MPNSQICTSLQIFLVVAECPAFALSKIRTVNVWEIKFSSYSKCMEKNLIKNQDAWTLLIVRRAHFNLPCRKSYDFSWWSTRFPRWHRAEGKVSSHCRYTVINTHPLGLPIHNLIGWCGYPS